MSWGYVLAAAGLTVIILFPCLDSKEGTFLRGWILGSSLLLCLLRMGLKLDEDYRFFKREGKVLP